MVVCTAQKERLATSSRTYPEKKVQFRTILRNIENQWSECRPSSHTTYIKKELYGLFLNITDTVISSQKQNHLLIGPRRCLNDTDRGVSRESFIYFRVVESESNWLVIKRVKLLSSFTTTTAEQHSPGLLSYVWLLEPLGDRSLPEGASERYQMAKTMNSYKLEKTLKSFTNATQK